MRVFPCYLNGELTCTDKTRVVVNPANEEAVAAMSTVDRATVAKAIQDAHQAFMLWRQTTGKSRGELLRLIANELERRGDEVARYMTLENGKPLTQSKAEVDMAVDHLRWFAEEARRGYGRVIPQQVDNKRHLAIKTPLGVVGAISPWNFPLMLGVRKVAPALAAGCTVILKPASATPLSSALFAECVNTANLPAGVFQLVSGSAEEIGQEFLDNPLCRKITFTGSTEVGRKLIAGAAKQVKSLSLELGGHAPVLVFEDADLPAAVEEIMMAKFRNSGQSCIAANRIFVQRSIYSDFLMQFSEKTRALKVGDGLEPKSQVGPLIDKEALARALEHIEDARRGGARIVCGGKRISGRGNFIEPTVLADVPKGSLCMHEETFAPVAPVSAFETEADAIQQANSSAYGLSAYVFTRDMSRVFRTAEQLDAGIIGVNDGVPTTSQSPFGGVKQSGWGRELGTEGMDAFLVTKHVSLGLS
jgi:succinate-semialdehyde dehydrogenase/glutarate-semialdehyde dehydrogenase